MFGAAAGHEDGDPEQQQDRDLRDHAEPEHFAAEGDVPLAAKIDGYAEAERVTHQGMSGPPCEVTMALEKKPNMPYTAISIAL